MGGGGPWCHWSCPGVAGGPDDARAHGLGSHLPRWARHAGVAAPRPAGAAWAVTTRVRRSPHRRWPLGRLCGSPSRNPPGRSSDHGGRRTGHLQRLHAGGQRPPVADVPRARLDHRPQRAELPGLRGSSRPQPCPRGRAAQEGAPAVGLRLTSGAADPENLRRPRQLRDISDTRRHPRRRPQDALTPPHRRDRRMPAARPAKLCRKPSSA